MNKMGFSKLLEAMRRLSIDVNELISLFSAFFLASLIIDAVSVGEELFVSFKTVALTFKSIVILGSNPLHELTKEYKRNLHDYEFKIYFSRTKFQTYQMNSC